MASFRTVPDGDDVSNDPRSNGREDFSRCDIIDRSHTREENFLSRLKIRYNISSLLKTVWIKVFETF